MLISDYFSLLCQNENVKDRALLIRIKQDVKTQALLFYSYFRDFNTNPWVL